MPDDRLETLNDLPGYALRRAASAMMADLAAQLAPVGLHISDAAVLLLVSDRIDLTSSEIGRVLEIQRANMVPLLNRLENAGLIQRNSLDRKSHAIVLTAAGQERYEQVCGIIASFEAALMKKIPAAHRRHFLPALKALVA